MCACSASNKTSNASNTELPDAAIHDASTQTDASSGSENLATEARACPDVRDADNAGPIGPKSLSETSGLVASRTQAHVLWMHNDSGDKPRLFATRDDGLALATIEIKGADAVDWEDIAVGPGPAAGKSYLYIGDIGDNEGKREDVQIYRLEEPAFAANGEALATSVKADQIDVRYEDGAHDAETLLSDPVSGDLYIIEKRLMNSGVYRVRAPATGDSKVTAKRVADIDLVLATGGDVLADGSGLALRTYLGVSYWARDPQKALEHAFAQAPCSLKLAAEQQGEALGFFADGAGYFTVSEGEGAILHAYRFE